jgi:hypothetical protein
MDETVVDAGVAAFARAADHVAELTGATTT